MMGENFSQSKEGFCTGANTKFGNNGDEGEEMMKMREENGIAGSENVKVI